MRYHFVLFSVGLLLCGCVEQDGKEYSKEAIEKQWPDSARISFLTFDKAFFWQVSGRGGAIFVKGELISPDYIKWPSDFERSSNMERLGDLTSGYIGRQVGGLTDLDLNQKVTVWRLYKKGIEIAINNESRVFFISAIRD